jgi:stage V sporulation protein S
MIMRVASTTPTAQLAGAIAHHLREDGDELSLQAIGAAAVNRAMKAAATARAFLEDDGIDFTLAPHWEKVEGQVEGEQVSALRFEVVATGDGG